MTNSGKLAAVTLGLALAGCGDSTGTTQVTASGGQESSGGSSGMTGPAVTSSGETPTTTDSGSGSATQSTGPGTTVDPTTATSSTTADPTTTTTTETTTGGVLPSSTSTTGSTGGSTGDGTSTGVGASSSGGDSTTGPPPKCEPGDGMGGGMVEKSFIWIASENTSDVSKIDTLTMTELARYRTGPGGESPSRTAVSADGRYVVVNNRQTGRSTMIAANVEDCVDKNGNGQIDTSQNKANLLAFGADECVRWSITHPFLGQWQHGPRGITWTPGVWSYDECKYVDPKVWLGYMSNAGNNTVHLVRLDGVTGVLEETIPVPGWNGSGFAPYGAALDPEFRPWFSSLRGEFVRVNTELNPITITRYTPPGNVQSYGFTVDRYGNPWFGGNCGPVTVFDVKSQSYINVPNTQNGCWRGVTGDENFLWAANNSPCGFAQIDLNTRTLVNNWSSNPCSTAIGFSIDAEKKVWLVNQGGFAYKFDPLNVMGMQKIDVLGSHYVYSDMTGGQVASILPQ